MMDSTMQQPASEAHDAEIGGIAASAAEAGPSQAFQVVEYGSGWYHDAAIVASEQTPAQRH